MLIGLSKDPGKVDALKGNGCTSRDFAGPIRLRDWM
jgi:hypothetical protein